MLLETLSCAHPAAVLQTLSCSDEYYALNVKQALIDGTCVVRAVQPENIRGHTGGHRHRAAAEEGASPRSSLV